MKKILIAVAAMSVVGSAVAQSTVTLSGALDVGVVRNGAAKTTVLNQAGNGLNQIVFSGSEDMGGGMRANFNLQQRFNPTNGNNDGTNAGRRTFQGASTVGLSGGFGNVRFGREIEAYNDVNNWADPWGTVRSASIAVASGNASRGADGTDLGRTEGIHYDSPKLFGGLTVGATFGFEDQTTPQKSGLPNGLRAFKSGNAVYSVGSVTLMAALLENRYGDDGKVFGAGLNVGPFEVRIARTIVDGGSPGVPVAADKPNPVVKYRATQVGLWVPMGATTLNAGYITSTADGVDSNKLGLGASYALSKRTSLIGTVGKTKGVQSNMDLSVRHTF